MTREIPEAEALALTVRGDVPGVLDGYVGPVQADDVNCPGAILNGVVVGIEPFDVAWADYGVGPLGMISKGRTLGRDVRGLLRLPLASPLAQAHLVGWLGRGEKCGHCHGFGQVTSFIECEACNGTGWTRLRFNRYPWLTPEALGGLPDWIRLALIWGSVERVAAGMGPIVDVADVWAEGPHDHGIRSRLSFDRAVCYVQAFPRAFVVKGPARDPYIYRYNWSCDNLPNPGRRDRLGGAQEADAYLMSKDFAIVDNTPEGRVIRFEVPE